MLLPIQADRWQGIVLEWTIAFITAAALMLPRASLVLLSMFALTAGLILRSNPKFFQNVLINAKTSKVLIAAVGVLAWALSSSIWSVDSTRSLMMPTLITMVVLVATFAVYAVDEIEPADYWFLMRGIVVGFAIGLAYLVIEELTDRGLMRAVLNNLPFLKGPTPSLVTRFGNHIAAISPSVFNRHLAVLSALIWPVLFTTLWLARNSEFLHGWKKVIGATLFATTAYVIIVSDHESSKLALVLSATVFAAASIWPQKTKYAVMAMWAGATLLMVPAVQILDHVGVKDIKQIQRTGRDRIYIWTHTVRQFYKSPIVGIGAAGTPIVNTRRSTVDRSFEFRLNRHAHNMFLQNSYELGAIGALLMCVFGIVAIQAMAGLGSAYLPFGLAHFSAIMGLMVVSYGMWQFWLMSAFAISMVIAKIASGANASDHHETL